MNYLQIAKSSLLALTFATTVAAQNHTTVHFCINANRSQTSGDGYGGGESEWCQPSVPSNIAIWQSANCQAGLPECAMVFDDATSSYTIISGNYRF